MCPQPSAYKDRQQASQPATPPRVALSTPSPPVHTHHRPAGSVAVPRHLCVPSALGATAELTTFFLPLCLCSSSLFMWPTALSTLS